MWGDKFGGGGKRCGGGKGLGDRHRLGDGITRTLSRKLAAHLGGGLPQIDGEGMPLVAALGQPRELHEDEFA